MPRTAYVNGQYVPLVEAGVSVEDRGLQFADGVYEVIAVIGGNVADLELHVDRLEASLGALDIPQPMSRGAMTVVMKELIRRNRVRYGIVYLQINRGAGPRDHAGKDGLVPTITMTCRPYDFVAAAQRAADGVSVRTVHEDRWAHPNIKTVALLPNVLAKQAARRAGDFEAWFVADDNTVTEGTSTNAWIVTGDGTLVTRPLKGDILPGVVRGIIIEMARALGLQVEERAFSVEEAAAAKEAFLTSTTGGVVPVSAIDGSPVANGAPGETTLRLARAYREHLAAFDTEPAAAMAVFEGR